ncbi:MAG TPA: ATP-binding protein [Burkholderiaceae bacterium]|nr:ATP-binding protein [Burkholderiaceae bacterium]
MRSPLTPRGSRVRAHLPMWMGAALLICAVATLLAVIRIRASLEMVEGLMHEALIAQSNDMLDDIVLAADQLAQEQAGPHSLKRLAARTAWPAHALFVALRRTDGRIETLALHDGSRIDDHLLRQAWSAGEPIGSRLAAGHQVAVVWRTIFTDALKGERLVIGYSTARISEAARKAVSVSLRTQALQLAAVLGIVLGYLLIQASALRRLARHARTALQEAHDLTSPPALNSPLIARELAELREALQQANLKVNRALARNEELWQVFRSATSTGGEALVILDAQSNVLLCNERVETLLRRPLGEVVGRPLAALLAPESALLLECEMKEFRRIGRHPCEGQPVERQVLQGDGHVVPVRMMLRSVSFEGAPCLCVSIRELSEEKQQERKLEAALQQAQQAHAAKARFLANMSHEIRTPLNGITGMAQLLADTRLDDQQHDLLQTLSASTRRLRSLLDDILDLSKIEAGQLRLERRPFDVELELRRAVRQFEGAALARQLALRYEFNGEPRLVVGDSHRLTQIVHNLLDNAIKFTDAGRVLVSVTSRRENTDDSACRLQVEVSDTGAGIPEDLQFMLFAAFTQADETTTRRFGGTGLGLAVSRELCQAMQGDISVTSQKGQGAVFRFHVLLGIAPTPEASTAPVLAPQEHEPVPLQGRHVLVADDSAVNRKVLEVMLRRAGIHFDVALNGAEAVERMRDADYDLVLMDVSMPVMNGYDATRAIRRLAPCRGEVPVIGVTALAMEGDRERCLAAGMNAYLAKPIHADDLFRTMRAALRREAVKA